MKEAVSVLRLIPFKILKTFKIVRTAFALVSFSFSKSK